MHAFVIDELDRLDARRILAWAATIAAHALAVGAFALPVTPPAPRTAAPKVEVALRMEPPALPAPPAEPLPTPKAKPVPARTPEPIVREPAPEAPHEPIQTEDLTTVIPTARYESSDPPAGDDVGNGETRPLAYAEPMRLRYPATAIRARTEGKVLLKVRVDVDGKVERIEIARSSGHATLDAAAREAVRHARFKPVLRDGIAVPAWGLVPIAFRLDQA